jgi:hypothetical protein
MKAKNRRYGQDADTHGSYALGNQKHLDGSNLLDKTANGGYDNEL